MCHLREFYDGSWNNTKYPLKQLILEKLCEICLSNGVLVNHPDIHFILFRPLERAVQFFMTAKPNVSSISPNSCTCFFFMRIIQYKHSLMYLKVPYKKNHVKYDIPSFLRHPCLETSTVRLSLHIHYNDLCMLCIRRILM